MRKIHRPRPALPGFSPRTSAGTRHAFTIIEVLIALIVFTVGGLALAASTAVVLRRLHTAHTTGSAALVAASRIARMGSSRCGALASGSAMHGSGITETWEVVPYSAGTARLKISLNFASGAREERFETVVECR